MLELLRCGQVLGLPGEKVFMLHHFWVSVHMLSCIMVRKPPPKSSTPNGRKSVHTWYHSLRSTMARPPTLSTEGNSSGPGWDSDTLFLPQSQFRALPASVDMRDVTAARCARSASAGKRQWSASRWLRLQILCRQEVPSP